MEVRLDKWLKVARIFKTRSRAAEACARNRVAVNGQSAKAHRLLRVDDVIEVDWGDWKRILRVAELQDKSVSKEKARQLYEDRSPPRPQLDPLQRLLRRPPEAREKGAGRPTKRDRRRIDDWKGSGS